MAHHALIRPTEASWTGVVLQSEWWAIDQGIYKSINGDEGGSWAPSSQIVIGGSGVSLTGPNAIGGATTLTNVTTMTMSGTNRVTYASRSVTRKQNIFAGHGINWALDDGGASTAPWWESTSAGGSYLWIRLKIPVGAVLTSCSVVLEGANLHSGVPISPEVALRRTTNADPSATIAATVTSGVDAPAYSGSVGDYQQPFTMTATAAHARVQSETMWVRIKNETGGDALAGLKVYEVETTCTLTSQDEHDV
jgi:hypothetical protein